MDAFTGEIMTFGGGYAPANWALCQGQVLSINQYQILYSLIGTTYGGDGVNNFRLPDLQGVVMVGMGQGQGLTSHALAQAFGVPTVTVQTANIPPHTHQIMVDSSDQPGLPSPTGALLTSANCVAASAAYVAAAGAGTPVVMATQTVDPDGGVTTPIPLPNFMPTMAMTMMICVQGLYPTRQ